MSFDSEKQKSFPQSEKEILEFWQKNKIFEKTLAKTRLNKPFVFFEGPPYANGRPGIHHVLSRAFKDVILRFKTMQGFYVRRKAGWDTHGLPTEMEVEKQLGIKNKRDIEEKIGIERFVDEAKKNVFSYKEEWEKMTERMGYWLDLKNPYVTMANSYIEALWRVFSRIGRNGYLYKDYRVLPHCPRCQTSLSSHELAQGYKKIKENSIYVKFKLKSAVDDNGQNENYFLAWTTTPWTLPGNAALALNSSASYAIVEKNGERLILAKDRIGVLGGGYKIIDEKIGRDLAGLEYSPLYKSEDGARKYKSIEADFVSVKDGTGIVHIAPAFGADDERAAKKNNISALMTAGEDGRMKTPGQVWHEKNFQDAKAMIIQDLKDRGLLFKEEFYEHDYPFCWRCGSALMYLAKDSWFFKTTAVKKRMLEENEKIGWRPAFFKKGRFGEWLSENIDWSVSRERYWGMPLPVWQCQNCSSSEAIGSLAELDEKSFGGKTRIFAMRHGEANHNLKNLPAPARPEYDVDDGLTEKGIKQARKSTSKFKVKIDLIISSPLSRARQTARIAADVFMAPVEVNENIREYDIGEFHAKSNKEADAAFPFARKISEPFPAGESLREVRARMVAAIKDIAEKHPGKSILIISHGDPLWVLAAALEGLEENEYPSSWYPETGEIKELKIHNWPYNRAGQLDLHRPYVDEIKIRCQKCGNNMSRVKDVGDVWFDSGAMPFAQYPEFWKKIENGKLKIKDLQKFIPYPADYIAEGVDQTRGWFYTLLAVSSLLELPAAYKNVLSLGLVLDEKGEKMSKSRGNVVEPAALFDKYGADAVRWHFYTVNQPWDEKLFREADVAGAGRRFLNIFWNSFIYWQTYKTGAAGAGGRWRQPSLLINKWVLARLKEVMNSAAGFLGKFDALGAARAIENFVVEDLSHWHIRRIRDPIRFGDKKEKEEISLVLGAVFSETAKLLAPFIPFLAERVWRGMKGKGSVHLEKWPKSETKLKAAEKKLLHEMKDARRVVALVLEERAKSGVKVRQPLALLKLKSEKLRKNKPLLELIKGETNVKQIVFEPKIKNEVELDLILTAELKEEGRLNDFVRAIQDKRKQAGFQPKDKIVLAVKTDADGRKFVEKYKTALKKEAGIRQIIFGGEVKTGPKTKSVNFEFY